DSHTGDLHASGGTNDPRANATLYLKQHVLEGKKWQVCKDWKSLIAQCFEVLENRVKPFLYTRWPILLVLAKSRAWRDENLSGTAFVDRLLAPVFPSYDLHANHVGWRKFHLEETEHLQRQDAKEPWATPGEQSNERALLSPRAVARDLFFNVAEDRLRAASQVLTSPYGT
ncbi:unnamed protein product, partial [Amoebophrya sp. A120]